MERLNEVTADGPQTAASDSWSRLHQTVLPLEIFSSPH